MVVFIRVSCVGGILVMCCDSLVMFNEFSEVYSRFSVIRNRVEVVMLNIM